MRTTIIAERSVLEVALAAAEQIGQPGQLRGLKAPLDASLLGRLNDVWDGIKDALEKGFEWGREKARPVLEDAGQHAEKAISEAGALAKDLKAALLDRLREYLTTFIDGMLMQIRPDIRVGEAVFSLSQVQLEQRILLTGSLKASLQEAFALTADGELTITAEYGLK